MGTEDGKVAQVKLQTSGLPPIDTVRIAKNTSNMVFNKYIRTSHENKHFTRKVGSLITRNKY
jgi:hypothetical protein